MPKRSAVSLSSAGQTIVQHDEASVFAEVTSLTVDMLPVVGTLKSVGELITGKDLVTGEEVGRFSSAAGIALGMIPGGKLLTKGKKSR